MERYVLEGTWSGYRSSQERVCHRTVLKRKNVIDNFRKLHTVVFTDNTTMSLTLRKCKPREKVKEIHGYDSLLSKIEGRGLCEKGRVIVAELYE